MCAFSYAWSLPVMWKRWHLHHSIRHAQNTMLHAYLMAVCFIEAELWLIEVLHCWNTHFRPFLPLWPWPWPDDLHIRYELVPYSMEIHRMCKYKLPRSSYRLTDIHREPPKTQPCIGRLRWNFYAGTMCFQSPQNSTLPVKYKIADGAQIFAIAVNCNKNSPEQLARRPGP